MVLILRWRPKVALEGWPQGPIAHALALRDARLRKSVGGLASQPKLTAEFVKMGARYVSTGTDLGFLLSAATASAKQIRALDV